MAAPYSGRTIDYLGSGLLASRPAAPNLYPGTVGLYYCTDVGSEKLTAWDGSVWADVGGGGGGFANPMTTAEDIIVGGVAGAPARLGKGADGTFLGVVAGALAYASPPGGSYTGTAGSITLTGSAFSIDPSYVGQTSITTLGTVATGTWNATAISAVKGGTGQTGYTVGDLLYASSTTALSKLAVGTDGYVLTLASGVPTWAAASGGGGGLTGFTSSMATASPNNLVNVSQLLASGGTADQDVALQPNGTNGGVAAQVATGTTVGGNKRGGNAVDWQTTRNAATQVASGKAASIGGGINNTASGAGSVVNGGQNHVSSGPESVVGGGSGNTSSSTQSTVGGGNTNTASGARATVGGGFGNTASVQYGTVAGGNSNSATTGDGATVGGGQQNVSSATNNAIAGGFQNVGNGQFAWIPGGHRASNRGIYGCGAYSSGPFSATGDAQHRDILLRASTTNATPATVSTDATAAGTANQVVLPNNSSFIVKATVNARQNTTGDAKSWEVTAHVKRGANAAATAMVAAATIAAIAADAGAAAWALAVTADTTNGCLKFEVTGEAAKTIRWLTDVYSCNEVVG